MKSKIIAFTGLPMTGKSSAREITEELLTKKGVNWERVYFGGVVVDEVTRRNQNSDWSEGQDTWTQAEKEKWVREEIRRRDGLGAVAMRCLPKIDEAIKANKLVVIDDLYSDEERQIIIEHYGETSLLLVALNADWKVRVERGKSRAERPYTESELKDRDRAEIYNLHKAPPIALAHFTIVNNYKSPEGLRKEIEARILPNLL